MQVVHEILKLLNHMMPSTTRDNENIQLVLAKETILEEQPMFLYQFSADILPVLIEVHMYKLFMVVIPSFPLLNLNQFFCRSLSLVQI